MVDFLEHSKFIDWRAPRVKAKAEELAGKSDDKLVIAKRCFEFVRDEVKHSSDYQCGPVTMAASEVLEHGTGFCYAKSHLLAALLRANSIPTALCYQRLSVGDGLYCLHGLNAIWLPALKAPKINVHTASEAALSVSPPNQIQLNDNWWRVDARGNRHQLGGLEDINCEFNPPDESLAFSVSEQGEVDVPELYACPLPIVAEYLQATSSVTDLETSLPDLIFD